MRKFERVQTEVRRSSLIEATARVLARDGASGASVRAIAAEAKVSPGLVTHHFASVDTLVACTYADVAERVAVALATATAAAGDDPRARLEAYVAGSFAPPVADPSLLATWTALWGLTRSNAAASAEHDRSYAAYRSALESLLTACGVPAGELRLTALSIAALVDGLWLELCLSPGGFTADEARFVSTRHLAHLLGTSDGRSERATGEQSQRRTIVRSRRRRGSE
ncbi:MAG TPA: TetR family transcriptional regulator C-terminal domain-containing protein [Sphingomonas sp.]|jgi:AcrR family transcriptional regulator|nr:TetR family transcriptional regulator C-terminal domain-containing protein [Sphingomonas sp.]